jgi:hypothetical protein
MMHVTSSWNFEGPAGSATNNLLNQSESLMSVQAKSLLFRLNSSEETRHVMDAAPWTDNEWSLTPAAVESLAFEDISSLVANDIDSKRDCFVVLSSSQGSNLRDEASGLLRTFSFKPMGKEMEAVAEPSILRMVGWNLEKRPPCLQPPELSLSQGGSPQAWRKDLEENTFEVEFSWFSQGQLSSVEETYLLARTVVWLTTGAALFITWPGTLDNMTSIRSRAVHYDAIDIKWCWENLSGMKASNDGNFRAVINSAL